jgi:hypothetical protein
MINYADTLYYQRLLALKDPDNYCELSQADQRKVDALLLRTTQPKDFANGYGTEWRQAIDEVSANLKSMRESRQNFEQRNTNLRPSEMRGGFQV